MKYTLWLLIILFLNGCGVTQSYYKFQVKTFPYPRKSGNTKTLDSTLVLKAYTWADTADLLTQDWNQLKNYAKEHQLVLKTEKKKILVEKYEKQAKAGELTVETKTSAQELKDMRLIGTKPSTSFGRITLLMVLGIGLTFLFLYLLINAAINDVADECYIATVCYGDINAREVVILRRFRDQVMRRYIFSTMLVEIYYIISPSIARYLKGRTKVNYCIRTFILNPIVFVVKQSIKPLPV